QVTTADCAIIVLEGERHRAGFFIGTTIGYMIPSIVLTPDPNYKFSEIVPREYQPRCIDPASTESVTAVVKQEVSIFEEEYVDLEDASKVAEYSRLLFDTADQPGSYSPRLRGMFVEKLVMAKNINYGQAGSIGDHSTGTLVNAAREAWKQVGKDVDLAQLS